MAHFGLVIKKFLSLFLAISLAFSIVLCFFLWQKAQRETVYTVYTVITETDSALAERLSPGTRLTDGKSKEDAGRILAITKEAALAEDEKGVYTKAGRTTLLLKIEADGERRKGEITLCGFTPCVGETVYLYESIRLEGTCVRVRAV